MTEPVDPFSSSPTDPISPSIEDEQAFPRGHTGQIREEIGQQHWTKSAIRALALETATKTGVEFLQERVRQIAHTLQVQFVLVTEWVPGRTDRVRLVVGWNGSRCIDDLEYDLPQTPCEKVIQNGEAFFPRHVQKLFPQDTLLAEYQIESYLGIALLNTPGQITGHLAIMDVRPFSFDHDEGRAIISSFAGRIVAELERLRAESDLRESHEAIRSLYDVTSLPGLTFRQRVEALLALGCRRFHIPIGVVTAVVDEQLEVRYVWPHNSPLTPGMCCSLAETFCEAALKAPDPVAFHHASASEWRNHPGYRTLRFECYLGTKLDGQHTVHGTICFFGLEPKPIPFSQADCDFLRLMARWLSGELDQRAAEQALKDHEQLLEKVIDTATDAIYMKDITGKYLCINEAGAAVIGLPSKEIEGKRDLDLFPKETALQLIKDDREVFSGICRDWVETVVSKNGAQRVFSSVKVPHRDSDGRIVGLVGVSRDVTQQQQAERALRESETRLHRFVANAPVGLVILDEEKRLLHANKAFCELTGYTEEEVLGHTYELYTHPEDLPANLVLTDEFYRGVRPEYTYEKRYIKKSGEIIWVSVKATRVEFPGHTGPLLLATIHDITERKLATAEREQLSRDLHDNLLQALYAVGMRIEAGKVMMGKSPRKGKTHLVEATDQLNHLLRQVRQFIELLRQPNVARSEFGQTFRQFVASLSAAGPGALQLDVEDSVLSLIPPAQEEQLLNIAREAISNSMRHAKATSRSLRLSHTPRQIRLIISDDGIGFPYKQDPYHHGHGLANMTARAKKIGARLTIRTAPGKGTTVTVIVPKEKAVLPA